MLTKNLKEKEFVAFDLETTGLFPLTSKIIEIGAVKFTLDGEISRYETLVNPETAIPYQSFLIHGISDEMVKDSPLLKDVLPGFMEFIGDAVLVAHNAMFDASFISNYLHVNDLPVSDNLILDTKILAKNILPSLENHRLSTLVEFFKVPSDNFHRALIDAFYCQSVFTELIRSFDSNDRTIDFSDITEINPPVTFKIVTRENQPENLPEIYSPIQDAMLKSLKITICYRRYNGEAFDRDITPIKFMKMKEKLYLEAFCHFRGEKRTFKLNKITKISPV